MRLSTSVITGHTWGRPSFLVACHPSGWEPNTDDEKRSSAPRRVQLFPGHYTRLVKSGATERVKKTEELNVRWPVESRQNPAITGNWTRPRRTGKSGQPASGRRSDSVRAAEIEHLSWKRHRTFGPKDKANSRQFRKPPPPPTPGNQALITIRSTQS